MKRCLNCRQTYAEELSECPHCGYKPRSKNITTRRFERHKKYDFTTETKELKSSRSSSKSKKNIYAASGHSGAFYIKSGERLNKRYSVIAVMGFGAFGVAYECFDNFSKQHVVVKEYMPSYLVTRSPNGRDAEPISEEAEEKFNAGKESFIDENTKLSENNVECVPPLIECFRQNNTSYAVTELIGGESLSSILTRKGKLSYETTAGIITSVLQGLRRLNRVGIIHGDICPENIIVISENKTYLLDYNLSDFNKNVYTQRESGKPRPGYSAPELYFKDMEIGPWTDVYAAAAVMYKMLTGIALPNAVKRKSDDTVQPLSKLGVPISASADKAMMNALKIDYEKRTQNPEKFLNGFVGDGFDNITAVKAKKPAYSQTPSRAASKKRNDDGSGILKGILVFLTLAIIAVVIWFFISGVFPMPKVVSDFFGLSDSTVSSANENTASNVTKDTDTDSEKYNGDFYTESNSSDKEGSSSGGILDNLISGITSGITSGINDKVSSFVDEHLPGDTSSYIEENTSSYYDENEDYSNGYYDDYGNYYEYDNESSQENDDYTQDNSVYEDTSSVDIGEYFSLPTDEAADYVNSFMDNLPF